MRWVFQQEYRWKWFDDGETTGSEITIRRLTVHRAFPSGEVRTFSLESGVEYSLALPGEVVAIHAHILQIGSISGTGFPLTRTAVAVGITLRVQKQVEG
jgi:hypothetical protein